MQSVLSVAFSWCWAKEDDEVLRAMSKQEAAHRKTVAAGLGQPTWYDQVTAQLAETPGLQEPKPVTCLVRDALLVEWKQRVPQHGLPEGYVRLWVWDTRKIFLEASFTDLHLRNRMTKRWFAPEEHEQGMSLLRELMSTRLA